MKVPALDFSASSSGSSADFSSSSGSSAESIRVLCFLRCPDTSREGWMLSFQKDGDERQQIRYKRCPSMVHQRYRSNTAFLNGKLYVFGGVYLHLHWAEVFNPNHQSWSPLPEPYSLSSNLSNLIMTAVLESENKILLSFYETLDLLAFDVETQEWEIYDNLKDPIPFFGQAVVVDRVLYGCGCRYLYAYHLDTQLTMNTSFGLMGFANNTMFKHLPCDAIPSLQHVCGNSFCMFWKRENRPFYYVSFQLSERRKWGGIPHLHAYNLSIGSYQSQDLPPNTSLLLTVPLPDTAKWYDLNKVSSDNTSNEAEDEVMEFRKGMGLDWRCNFLSCLLPKNQLERLIL